MADGKNSNKQKRYTFFIEFEGEILQLNSILRVSRKEEEKNGEQVFQIIINDSVDESVAWPIFKRLTFSFYNERVREERFEELRSKLLRNPNILIV